MTTGTYGSLQSRYGVLAMRCAWCNRWLTSADEYLARDGFCVSHGICERCRDSFANGRSDGGGVR